MEPEAEHEAAADPAPRKRQRRGELSRAWAIAMTSDRMYTMPWGLGYRVEQPSLRAWSCSRPCFYMMLKMRSGPAAASGLPM